MLQLEGDGTTNVLQRLCTEILEALWPTAGNENSLDISYQTVTDITLFTSCKYTDIASEIKALNLGQTINRNFIKTVSESVDCLLEL